MVLFIIILCVLWFIIGYMFLIGQESGEVGGAIVVLIIGVLLSFFVFCGFFFIKGEDYFKPVHRHGDSVVYRDTQYGKVDTILYIINKDTVYYDEVK